MVVECVSYCPKPRRSRAGLNCGEEQSFQVPQNEAILSPILFQYESMDDMIGVEEQRTIDKL